MTDIAIRFVHPSTGEHLDGTVTFTPQHAKRRPPITEGAAVVSGKPVDFTVTGADTVISLRPSPPGWMYLARGRDETGWTFSELIRVPGETPSGAVVNYDDLDRLDPLALTAYSPTPEWWAWAARIEELGGIPGESAKETLERTTGESWTDAEFLNYITGPRGNPGNDGLDGYTALDFYRQEIGDPEATWDDFKADLRRGQSFLEQWAVYVGINPDTAEISDALDWLHGDTALDMWREQQDRPNATMNDMWEFLRGPTGRDSFAPGPPGPRGDSAYEAVVNSGYQGTEEEFAGHLVGSETEWEEFELINGWDQHPENPLEWRAIDGMLQIQGRLRRSNSDHWRMWGSQYLPDWARPARDEIVFVGTNHGTIARFILRANGDAYLHASNQGVTFPEWFYFDVEIPTAGGVTRTRIPGPQGSDGQDGTSAAESARRGGWEGEDYDFYARMRSMAHISDDDWDRFMNTTTLSRGPVGPRGESFMGALQTVDPNITEQDVYDAVTGDVGEWVDLELLNGTTASSETLKARVLDGEVHVVGTVFAGDIALNIAQLPAWAFHAEDGFIYRTAATGHSQNASARLAISTDGQIAVSSIHQGIAGIMLSIDMSWPATDPTTRPRIPGPPGISAYEHAVAGGYQGSLADYEHQISRGAEHAQQAADSAQDAETARDTAVDRADSAGASATTAATHADRAEEARDETVSNAIEVDTSVGTKVTVGGVVVFYDSGWRDVSNLALPEWTPPTGSRRIRLWRVGDQVFLEGRFDRAEGGESRGASADILSIPAGFRPRDTYSLLGQAGVFSDIGAVYTNVSRGDVRIRGLTGTWSAGDTVSISANWRTRDDYPTSLPGVPA